MKILALLGPKGSGKSTIARAIARKVPYCAVMSFTDPIRWMLAQLGVDRTASSEHPQKEQPHPMLLGRTPREALIFLGQEFGRTFAGPDMWVRQMEVRFEQAKREDTPNLIVIDDLRFANELAMVRRWYGKAVVLVPKGHALVASGDDSLHETECFWKQAIHEDAVDLVLSVDREHSPEHFAEEILERTA